MAQDPCGKKVGQDQRGNAIYQIRANGIEIGYKLIGSGEPLLMIMGIANTMERWPSALIETLSMNHQLILLDNRGIGYSTANDEEFTHKLFADDVIGLLDALKIKKINVFGVSMGSVITQELLLEYPQRFNKAIICATSIDGSNVTAAIKDRTPKDPIAQRQLKAVIHWKTPLDKVSRITNPVMLVVGTSDAVVGVASSKTLASTIPGAWLVQFTNASHLLVDEAPIELAKITLAFLDIKTMNKNCDKPRPRVGVAIVVVRDGMVLLGKRKGAHGTGEWSTPGGHLEFGESVEECAHRELLEETGLIALSVQLGPWVNDIIEKDKHYITLFAFVDRVEGNLQLLEPDKCEVWKWFEWDKLPSPLFPTIRSLIKKMSIEKLSRISCSNLE